MGKKVEKAGVMERMGMRVSLKRRERFVGCLSLLECTSDSHLFMFIFLDSLQAFYLGPFLSNPLQQKTRPRIFCGPLVQKDIG